MKTHFIPIHSNIPISQIISHLGKLILVSLLLVTSGQEVTGQDLSLTPANSSVIVPVPADFTLTAQVSGDPASFTAARLNLTFDPNVLQVVDAAALSGFAQVVSPAIDNAAGTIVFDVFSLSGRPDGDFPLASFTFRAISPGNAAIDFVLDGDNFTALVNSNMDVLQSTTGATVTVGSANTPPAVEITAPDNGASFNEGDDVSITASATDADGTVSTVEFFDGTTSLGIDDEAPFEAILTSITAGSHELTAVATDDDGAETTSATVSINAMTANALPSVSVTSPENGASFSAGDDVNISASALDSDGTVVSVEFFNGTSSLGTDTTAPFETSLVGINSGSYQLTAMATDNEGGETTSDVVTINVSSSLEADVVLIPSTTTAPNVGTTFTVRVEIQPVFGQLVDGAELSFQYDPTIIEVNGPDGFSTPSGPFNIVVPGFPLVTPGSPFNTITYTGGSTPPFPNDNFEVFTVEFVTVGEGTANLIFTGTNIIASNGQDILRDATGTTIVVGTANELPTVEITTPEDGTTFTAGEDVNITATASDTDGTIVSVEFFDGTTSLGTDNDSPFEATLVGITPGSHRLTATATDNEGGQTTSEIVTVNATNSLQADVVLIPSTTTVTGIGTTFTVRVEIQPVAGQPVDGAELRFQYDPGIIEVFSSGEVGGTGGFSTPSGPFNIVVPGSPSVTPGATFNTISYIGGSTPPFPNSDFEVFTVEFITVGEGTADLTFVGTNIIASNGMDILRDAVNTAVIVNGVVAPVELVSFNGRTHETKNILEWTAGREEAFSHYELQRGTDGGATNWDVIGEIAGEAAPGDARTYSYTDATPPNSAYYRLRMVDLDDTYAYSDIVHLLRSSEAGTLNVFPNPNEGRFTVELPTSKAVDLTLLDANGRLVWKQDAATDTPSAKRAENLTKLTVSNLTPGIYLLSAKSAAKLWTKRIVVK